MSYSFEGFAQQGWQCPICHRVYSPTTSMCYYCGQGETVTTSNLNIVHNMTKEKLEQMLDRAKEDSKDSHMLDYMNTCGECFWFQDERCVRNNTGLNPDEPACDDFDDQD